MGNEAEVWDLRQGDKLVGRLQVYDIDPPWYSARFEPTADFAAYRPLFAAGSALRTGEDPDAWAAWLARVREVGLSLIRLADGATTSDFILYVDGSEADFRPRFPAQPG